MDAFLDELRVHLVQILSQLVQHTLVILVVDDSDQYLYFLVFDVMRVRELAEEALDLVFQNGGSFLDDVLDVLEDDVLHLSGSEGHN